jgi:transketolase
MRDAFLNRVLQAMAQDRKIFFICADFGSPVLDRIREQFPKQFVNVGIAEQNLINVSAGLALEGYTVFAYAIAPFITMRCYEQIRVNMALLSEVRRMNVTLIGVGAGYSYVVSGPTHQCFEDLTVMRALPNIEILSPADHITSAAVFEQCAGTVGLKYLRLDAQVLPVLYEGASPRVSDGFAVLRRGSRVCMVGTGYMVHSALAVAERLASIGLEVGVVDLFNLTSFDAGGFQATLRPFSGVVTLEEGFRARGGLDAMMADFVAARRMDIRLSSIGVKPAYTFELGSRAELHEKVGIGIDVVQRQVREFADALSPARSMSTVSI